MDNISELGRHYTKGYNSLTDGHLFHDTTYMSYVKIARFIDLKTMVVVAGPCGVQKWGMNNQ